MVCASKNSSVARDKDPVPEAGRCFILDSSSARGGFRSTLSGGALRGKDLEVKLVTRAVLGLQQLRVAGISFDAFPQPVDMQVQRAGVLGVVCPLHLAEQNVPLHQGALVFDQQLQQVGHVGGRVISSSRSRQRSTWRSRTSSRGQALRQPSPSPAWKTFSRWISFRRVKGWTR